MAPVTLEQAALLSTPTPADLARSAPVGAPSQATHALTLTDLREQHLADRASASVKLRWIVHVAYTAPAGPDGTRHGTFRWLGRPGDGLPFEHRDRAERQAELEESRPTPDGAELIATCVPLSPPDPIDA